VFGTKVALVSVGAGPIKKRTTRWLSNEAAKRAYYRSYRDTGSKKWMQRRGIDTSGDSVYADLVFSLPAPPVSPGEARTVCVGVMDYYGSNDDRKNAEVIHRSYIDEMILFVEWLIDNDRTVLLVIGDANGSDDSVAQEILAKVRKSRPTMDPSSLVVEPSGTLGDVLEAMRSASSVVAIRFHNIVAALMLGKPTMVISYSEKHDALAASVNLDEFCQPARAMDHAQMIRKFTELEMRAPELRETLADHKGQNEKILGEQFAELSESLFSSWIT
jgi:polysaccharide pyruvyl transferase WcaK-like protein